MVVVLIVVNSNSSIKLEGCGTFWGIATFWSKKLHMTIHKYFWITLILHAHFFSKNVLIPQNVPILPNCILPTLSSRKRFITLTLLEIFNKRWIYFFFSHLLRCTNPTIYRDATLQALILHLTLFKFFTFSKFNMLDEKAVLTTQKNKKQFSWQKYSFNSY